MNLFEKLTTNAMNKKNVRLDDWESVKIRSQSVEHETYLNYCTVTEGSMSCWFNDKAEDSNALESRLHASDVLFEVYKTAALQDQQPPHQKKKFRLLWRYWITNLGRTTLIERTKEICTKILNQPHAPYAEFCREDLGY